MSTVVLSVRIKRQLKEEAEKLGINIRAIIERSLEEEIRKAKMERLKQLVDRALASMELSEEDWIKAVKEVRLEG